MLGTAVAFVGREVAVGINLCLESLQEGLTGWPRAGATVDGAAP